MVHWVAVLASGASGLAFMVMLRRGVHHKVMDLLASQVRGSAIRPLSTSAVTNIEISQHLQLKPAPVDAWRKANMTKRLVLFFPWLHATSRGQQRYIDLYHQRGMDVISVKCELRHFLWPNYARDVAHELLSYLSREQKHVTDFIVHSTSVGAFVYTVVMMEMMKHADKYQHIHDKIQAQVYDSLTMGGLHQMTTGITQNSSNAMTRLALTGAVNTYFYLTKKHTVDFYEEGVSFFKSAPLKTPVLVYYSQDDKLCCSDDIETMIKKWHDLGIQVSVQSWPRSTHAGHLKRHPQHYKKALDNFLSNLGITILSPETTISKL